MLTVGLVPTASNGCGESARMLCEVCQHENRDGRKFCVECGAALALKCPTCGAACEAGEKFCGECGAPLREVESRQSRVKSEEDRDSRLSPLDSRLTSDPRAYTPKHLADKILQSKSALEGERKQVTVLFADVKGSMELRSSSTRNSGTRSSTVSSPFSLRACTASRAR